MNIGVSGCFQYFSLGLLFWFLGETAWAIYALVLGVEVPYSSIADAFWFVGYPLFMLALITYLRVFPMSIGARKLRAAVLISAFLVLVVVVTVVVPTISLSLDPWSRFFDIGYPALDVVTLFLSLTLIVAFKGGELMRVWYFLTLGLNVAADILFSYTTALGLYYAGNPLDVLFDYGYVLFALGLYEHTRIL